MPERPCFVAAFPSQRGETAERRPGCPGFEIANSFRAEEKASAWKRERHETRRVRIGRIGRAHDFTAAGA